MLKITNLSYHIHQKSLLDAINLDFQKSRLYGILGPNGSGKTTFLKIINGLIVPSLGEIKWQGISLLQLLPKERSRITAYVSQTMPSLFDFTVDEFVEMGRYAVGQRDPRLHRWALETVNAWHYRHCIFNELSQGEKQRACIARALVTEAPILLLDEPTANLDLKHQMQIWQCLKEISAQGKLILITHHDFSAIQAHCHSAVLLSKGQCVAQGSFSHVLTPIHIQQVFGIDPKSLPNYPE